MKKNIVVIDDNIHFVRMFCENAKAKNHNILVLNNYHEVETLMNSISDHIDGILIDYSTVEKELTNILRCAKKICPDCVILTSGRVDIDKIVNKILKKRLANYYLPKPFSITEYLQLFNKK